MKQSTKHSTPESHVMHACFAVYVRWDCRCEALPALLPLESLLFWSRPWWRLQASKRPRSSGARLLWNTARRVFQFFSVLLVYYTAVHSRVSVVCGVLAVIWSKHRFGDLFVTVTIAAPNQPMQQSVRASYVWASLLLPTSLLHCIHFDLRFYLHTPIHTHSWTACCAVSVLPYQAITPCVVVYFSRLCCTAVCCCAAQRVVREDDGIQRIDWSTVAIRPFLHNTKSTAALSCCSCCCCCCTLIYSSTVWWPRFLLLWFLRPPTNNPQRIYLCLWHQQRRLQSSSYEYVGCFADRGQKDAENRALDIGFDSSDMTPDVRWLMVGRQRVNSRMFTPKECCWCCCRSAPQQQQLLLLWLAICMCSSCPMMMW